MKKIKQFIFTLNTDKSKLIGLITFVLLVFIVIIACFSHWDSVIKESISYTNMGDSLVPIGEIVSEMTVNQTVHSNNVVVTGFSLLFATYMRTNDCIVTVSMLSDTNNVIQEWILNAAYLRDNSHVIFNLNEKYLGEFFVICITSNGQPDNAVTIWSSANDVYPDGELTINGNIANGDLCFTINTIKNGILKIRVILLGLACLIITFLIYVYLKIFVLKNIECKFAVVLLSFLVITWLIGISNFFFSFPSYVISPMYMYDMYGIDGKKHVYNLYPHNQTDIQETENKITYSRVWTGNNDVFLMITVIDIFVIMLWLVCLRTGYLDKIFVYLSDIIQKIKLKHRKLFLNILFIMAISIISVLIGTSISVFIFKKSSFIFYRILFYVIAGLVLYCIVVLRGKPDKLFLSLSLLIGLLYVLSIPPYVRVTWDEEIHYNRAVELSFIMEISKNNTDFLISHYERYIDIDFFDKSNRESFINSEYGNVNYTSYLKSSKKHTSFYQNIGYIPASLGIFIGRSLALPPDIICMLGRIVIHLFYTLLVFVALKRLKSGKYIIAIIAMSPSVFFQSTVHTYDYWIIAFLMLGFVYFFYEIQNPEEKTTLKNLIIMISSFVLGLGAKAIYFPMMIILYFMGKNKFHTQKGYNLYITAITLSMLFIVLSFMLPFVIERGGTGDLRGGTDVSPVGQVKFIFQNPLIYTKILLKFLHGFLTRGYNYISNYAYLGNASYFGITWVLLVFAAITDREQIDRFSSNIKYKVITSILVLSTIVLFSTALYVSFTGVGTSVIAGVQKRYLFPLLFPFFYVIGTYKIQNNINKSIYSCIIFSIASFLLLNGIWEVCISKYS